MRFQFDVRLNGKRITISSRAGQSLFAYLTLTAGTPHRREKLAGTFWPDTSDESARKNLRQELWRIRKAITAQKTEVEEFLLADEFTIAFNRNSEYWLDAAQVERPDLDLESLTNTLSLYQGELLSGFYDEWVILERERIQSIFDNKMGQLLDQLITTERWIAVQEQSERWLALGSMVEPAYRALMLAYGARGDMAKVSTVYQRCIADLREQFGIEPSAETRALYDGLLKGAHLSPQAPGAQFSGTVTFLFTDIEGSTNLLSQLGDQYATLLADHHKIMRTVIQKWNGREVDTQGDAFFVTFGRALDAIQCVAEAQRALSLHKWIHNKPLRVRMGIHTGEPLITSTGYVGMDVHRAARIGDAGYGGQVLLSHTTRELVFNDLPQELTIRDLGEYRLKDMKFPSSIYQLVIEGLPFDFPPLRTKFSGTEAPTPGEAPFKGLQYFDEADSSLFFGRELLTAKLVNRLRDSKFLSVIIGASGSGKSSLVRAGLIPAIKKEQNLIGDITPQKNSSDWDVHIITPTAHPVEALAIELTRESESLTAATTLMDDLMQDPRSLAIHLAKHNQNQHIMLVLDQFEELFTLCRDEFEREAFIDNLLFAISPSPDKTEKGGRQISLILTLRADFYAHLAQYPELRDAVARQQEYIGPMTPDELRRAIEEPAIRAHWAFEPGLVDLILRDVGDEPGALPLLSHALLETWKRRAGHTLTLKGYADAGGVRGAIAHTAESVYLNLSPEEQVIAQNIFLRLTELGEGTEDTRRRVSFDELMSNTENIDEVREVLNMLAEARLITLGEDTAEVAHEALIREWPTLREWLNQDREGLQLHRRLTETAREWELLERDAGVLYRGAQLAQAREWVALHPNALNEKENAFLNASKTLEQNRIAEREAQQRRELEAAQQLAESEHNRAEEQAQATNRMRLRNRIITVVGIIALAFGGLAMIFSARANKNADAAQANLQQALTAEAQALTAKEDAIAQGEIANEARDNATAAQETAQSRELAMAAINNITTDPERSVLLALEGLSFTHTREAEEALHQSLLSLRTKLTMQQPDVLESVDYSSDGKLLLTSSDDGTARVWSVETGRELFILSGHSDWVNEAVFSPDDKQIATAGNEGVAKIWDVETRKELFTLIGHTAFVSRIAFSPDGKYLATGSGDNTVKIWNVSTGEEIQTLYGHTRWVNSIAFSSDSTQLAASSSTMLIVWDTTTGGELLSIKDAFQSVAVSPDGTQLAAGTISGAIKVYDATTGSQLLQLSGHSANVLAVKFSPDGTQIASASQDRTAIIWDSITGQALLILAGHTDGLPYVDFSPDGKSVATASWDGTARIWDIASSGSKEVLTLTGRSFGNVNFNPDEKQIVTAGFVDGVVQIWDAESGQEVIHIDAHEDRVYQAVFSPDGKRIATSSADNTVKIWDAKTGLELLSISGHGDGSVGDGLFPGVLDVAFSPDGNRLATAGADGVAKIWNSKTGEELFVLKGDTTTLVRIRFSPDGSLIATGSEEPDTRAQISIFDANSGEEIWRQLVQQDRIWGLAFNSKGDHVVTAGAGGIIKIWDVETGQELMDIPDYTASAADAAFSPDGSHLAIVGGDGLQVRDLEKNQITLNLPIHFSWIWAVSFTKDGSRLATASTDGTVRVIYIDIDDLTEHATSRITRSLTTAECQQYLHVDTCPIRP